MTIKPLSTQDIKIGQQFRRLRRRHRKNQAQIGIIFDVAANQISKIERGINRLSYNHAVILCDFFNISLDQLRVGIPQSAISGFTENGQTTYTASSLSDDMVDAAIACARCLSETDQARMVEFLSCVHDRLRGCDPA